jgi:ribonuclease-3
MSSNSEDSAGEAALAALLDHRFENPALLSQALTHSSAVETRPGGPLSYERLEFLGDRVLGLIVADMLLERFPCEPEGALARRHAFLVSREALAEVARGLELGSYIKVSRGEAESGGRENPALLADVCESLIGALYRDGGLEAARRFVTPRWSPLLTQDRKPPRDAKTGLQEWAQARGLPLPVYKETAREGPAHDPRFTVSVTIQGFEPVAGTGRSKRLAEQDAARRMMATLQSDEDTAA